MGALSYFQGRRGFAAAAVGLSALLGGGCASSSQGGKPSTSSGESAEVAPESSPSTVGDEPKLPPAPMATDYEKAKALDPTFDDVLNRVPKENIKVNVVQHVSNPEEARRARALASASIQPAIDEYALLGQYLRDVARTVPVEQRASVSAMADHAFSVARRLGVASGSSDEIILAAELKRNGSEELAEWMRVRGNPSSVDSFRRAGLLALKNPAPGASQDLSTPDAEKVARAWDRSALLLIAMGMYGENLFGPAVTERRRETFRHIALLIEGDRQTKVSAAPIVEADVQLGQDSERLMRIVALAGDTAALKMRNFSAEAGAQLLGANRLDANAYAKFCLFIEEAPSEENFVRWLVLREVPGVSQNFFKGNAAAPQAEGTPEIESLMKEVLDGRGLAR